MGGGGTIEPEGANWGGMGAYEPQDDEERRRLALQLALAARANRPSNEELIRRANEGLAASKPVALSNEEKIRQANAGLAASRGAAGTAPAMLRELATGAPPSPPAAPTPTPEGEALFADLQAADRASQPSLMERVIAARPKGPNLLAKAAEYLPAMLGGGGKGIPMPDVPVMLGGRGGAPAAPAPAPTPPAPPPPPAPAPTVQRAPAPKPAAPRMALEAPPNFTMQVPPTPYADEGSSPVAPPPPTATATAPAPAGIPDGPSALELALQQSRGNRLIAQLARAGGTAIGRGSGPGYDTLDEGAGRPLQELGLRQQEAAREAAAGAAAADADPNSQQSVMARALVAEVVPGLAKSPGFERASYSTLARGPLGKFIDANADLQNLRLRGQQEIDLLRAKQKAAGAGGGGLGKAGDAQLKELGEQYTKAGMPGFFQQYSEAKRILDDPKYRDDLPGYGRLAGRLPDELVSADGVALRQSLGAMLAEYRKGVTGAGMSDAERAEYGHITGLMQSGSDASVRQGVERLNRAMRARAKAMGSGFRRDVSGEYGRREPTFAAAMSGQGAAPPAAAPVSGWSDADEARLQELEAKARGGR